MNEKSKNTLTQAEKSALLKKPTLTLAEASRLSGIPYQTLRVCLQRGHFDFGEGYKAKPSNKKHRHIIFTKKFLEYVDGIEVVG